MTEPKQIFSTFPAGFYCMLSGAVDQVGNSLSTEEIEAVIEETLVLNNRKYNIKDGDDNCLATISGLTVEEFVVKNTENLGALNGEVVNNPRCPFWHMFVSGATFNSTDNKKLASEQYGSLVKAYAEFLKDGNPVFLAYPHKGGNLLVKKLVSRI